MTGLAAALPRSAFGSSTLVRQLSELARADGACLAAVAEPPRTVAQRLGAWLDWTDAIALSAALADGAAAAPALAPAPATMDGPLPLAEPIERCHRARRELTAALESDGPGDPSAQQRAMETRVGALRAQVRAVLAGHSPALRQLAALDAALDAALRPRQRHLLAQVPACLQRHAEHLQQTAAGADGDAAWRRDRQSLLQAELAFRLQPVDALLEALGAATPTSTPT